MTSKSSPALSFPREIFAALSPGPFLLAHLAPQALNPRPIRPNGRTPAEFRKPNINTGSLTHCSGSAVVRMGDTAVVCGVRAEILKAEDIPNPPAQPTANNTAEEEASTDAEMMDQLGLLVPNIELSTGSSPSNLPGSPPSTLAQSLITRARSLLFSTGMIPLTDLKITYTPPLTPEDAETPDAPPEEEVKGYWVLYIDTMFISLDGNAFDAAWGAILAALHDTKLPKAFWDEEMEMILCSDDPAEAKRLRFNNLPVPATFGVFKPEGGVGFETSEQEEERAWILSDPDAFEEGLCKECVTITVDRWNGRNKIRRTEKSGGGVVGRELMRGLVKKAEERWKDWEAVLGLQR